MSQKFLIHQNFFSFKKLFQNTHFDFDCQGATSVLGFVAKIKEISQKTLFKIIHASLIHVFKAKMKFENRLIW